MGARSGDLSLELMDISHSTDLPPIQLTLMKRRNPPGEGWENGQSGDYRYIAVQGYNLERMYEVAAEMYAANQWNTTRRNVQ